MYYMLFTLTILKNNKYVNASFVFNIWLAQKKKMQIPLRDSKNVSFAISRKSPVHLFHTI